MFTILLIIRKQISIGVIIEMMPTMRRKFINLLIKEEESGHQLKSFGPLLNLKSSDYLARIKQIGANSRYG